MDDYTFELDGIVFGLRQTVAVAQSGFQPGTADLAVAGQQGASNANATWVFEGFLDTETEVDALAALATLRRAWTRPRDVADQPPLRYALAGRTRRIYGKPSKWDQAIDNRLLSGGGGLSMEYVTADHLHYDDSEQSRILNIAPTSLGGYPVPFSTPWWSVHNGVSERSLTVGGDSPAPFTVTFAGPLTNGYVAGGAWRIELAASLDAGETVTVDTRPWSYGVTADGNPGAGLLAGATTGLGRARLDPNGETVTFGGTSLSGTATATIRWRAAWASL